METLSNQHEKDLTLNHEQIKILTENIEMSQVDMIKMKQIINSLTEANSILMKKLEENLKELTHDRLDDSEIEEEKDEEMKELTEKEKELQKKYMLEKFDIEVITEDFGCVHEIVAPKGFQRKGIDFFICYNINLKNVN